MKKEFDINCCIRQTDEHLAPQIRSWGCFFVSCLVIAQNRAGKYLTADQYNFLWYRAHLLGFMKNNFMVKSEEVINLAFKELGVPLKAIKIGKFVEGRKIYSNSFKELSLIDQEKYSRIDGLIQKIETDSEFKTHFRVVDKFGIIEFEPYLPSPNAIKIVRSDLYHIMEV